MSVYLIQVAWKFSKLCAYFFNGCEDDSISFLFKDCQKNYIRFGLENRLNLF